MYAILIQNNYVRLFTVLLMRHKYVSIYRYGGSYWKQHEWLNMVALKKERVEFRLSPTEKELLEEAALLSNTTVSKFVSESATDKAQQIIEQHKRLQIESDQWEEVMDALENPPEPTELMQEIIDMSMEDTWTVKTNK